MYSDAACGGQAREIKVLSPEQTAVASLAGCSSIKNVVQTQLAEIFLLRRQVFGFDNPQTQQIL